MNNLDFFYQQPSPYSLGAAEKQQVLHSHLAALDSHHQQHCELYRRIASSQTGAGWFDQQVFLPVRLFKEYELKSVAQQDVFKVLTSSGTTSQQVSRIVLDRETAAHQSKVLVKIMQHYLGVQRLPMLIIDHPSVVKDRLSFSARGAGILGLSTFGRDHTYALDDDMQINLERVQAFIAKHQGKPVFIFGFTFMVWQYFFQVLQQSGQQLDLAGSVLVHSGGWKKLIDIAVDNSVFKQVAFATCGIQRVHNFYGMVEQIGAVFVECEHGHLHCPVSADVLLTAAPAWL